MIVVAIALARAGSAYAAPTATELQERGEGLARDGHFSEAIDAFKAADRLESRASHACLIALAYTRRELWPQAEVWLATCQQRATRADALPDWAAELETTITKRLEVVNAAPITIAVEPGDADVKLAVSSFAPDETFAPRTIHLPPGRHVILAKAAGYADTEKVVDVIDRSPQHISIRMRKPSVAPDHGRALLVAGAIAAGAGAITYGWMSFEYVRLRDASNQNSLDGYNQHYDRYAIAKWSTLALGTTGAVCLVIGGVLHSRGDEGVVAGVAPISGGGLVTVGWQR